jgi:AhpD family alkylhydroperoxidase
LAERQPGFAANSIRFEKDGDMMLNWNDYRKRLLGTVHDMERIHEPTVKIYNGTRDPDAHIGRLDAKTRELIALAVSATRQSERCIAVHADEAMKHGATPEEIMEALGVAVAVNAGATLVYSARVMDACGHKTA